MSNSPVPMGRFGPTIWVAAMVFVCMSLLRVVVRPSESYESPRPFLDPNLWAHVDFATAQEIRRSNNVSNINTCEIIWLMGALAPSKVVFVLKCLGSAMVYAIGLATWIVTVAILSPRMDRSMVFGVVVGVLCWVLKWVARVLYAVATELASYLARVVGNLAVWKGNLARELIRARKDFPAPKGVIDKILEWVVSAKDAGLEKSGNFWL
ncbi:hypothetical protein C7212DRAFT_342963 [Tuber magnatum]|uniref:Uncharacterized protein n=1 Tax=Tuber magnatum TaxID=42249 RepID=A0A317SUR9_9PEZI|nr:hypothetical protein C7212DRAFT_342963 [Tuber magnatum]